MRLTDVKGKVHDESLATTQLATDQAGITKGRLKYMILKRTVIGGISSLLVVFVGFAVAKRVYAQQEIEKRFEHSTETAMEKSPQMSYVSRLFSKPSTWMATARSRKKKPRELPCAVA